MWVTCKQYNFSVLGLQVGCIHAAYVPDGSNPDTKDIFEKFRRLIVQGRELEVKECTHNDEAVLLDRTFFAGWAWKGEDDAAVVVKVDVNMKLHM